MQEVNRLNIGEAGEHLSDIGWGLQEQFSQDDLLLLHCTTSDRLWMLLYALGVVPQKAA